MYNHAPENYICPICLAVQGVENEHTMAKQADIVYRDDYAVVYVNSKFIKSNPGHVIVVPTNHFENLYDLPVEYLRRIGEVTKMVALAIKVVRKCDGIWVEQNNEPASGQHAFHYHVHIVPRFEGDDIRKELAEGNTYVAEPQDRIPYAQALRAYLSLENK